MTARELAAKVGVHPNTINNIENSLRSKSQLRWSRFGQRLWCIDGMTVRSWAKTIPRIESQHEGEPISNAVPRRPQAPPHAGDRIHGPFPALEP
jgi:hypothetical protein